jgi:hypothetical protein
MPVLAPRDVLAVATRLNGLASPPPTDAEHRSAISRSYYACFLAGRDAMFGLDGNPPASIQKKITGYKSGSVHRLVSCALVLHRGLSAGEGIRLQGKLDQLKALRVLADYQRDDGNTKVNKTMTENFATSWGDLAEVAEVLAESLLPELEVLPRFP